MKFELFNGGKKLEVEVAAAGEAMDVSFEGKHFRVELPKVDSDNRMTALVDGKEMSVTFDDETENVLKLTVSGRQIVLGRAQAQLQTGVPAPAGPVPGAEQNALLSPLFGKVISVDVKAGDSVDSGQSLVVLEAMKMESVLRADGKHVVKEVLVKEGDGVNKGQPIIRFG